uniref:A disintegrin and metalloproteinase with thrombospondin motifs 3-like isoform X2 n=1 Tax=Myxine glutinosa TaxID=7769 RepID=UPI00358ECF55
MRIVNLVFFSLLAVVLLHGQKTQSFLLGGATGDLSERLSEFEFTTPVSTDGSGAFLSLQLSASASSMRSRRSIRGERADERRFFNVTVSGRQLHLHLEPVGERLLAPGASAEWRCDGGASRRRVIRQDCVFRGSVTEIPNTVVALTNCDGLAGLIHLPDEDYFIEPLERGSIEGEQTRGRPHVIYRRSSIKTLLNPTATRHSDYALAEALLMTSRRRIKRPRRRRTTQPEVYNIEVLLAVDDSVVRFHGKHHVQNYLLTLMNIVNEIYQDESLGVKINIVLVRIIMLGYRQSINLIEQGNPSRSLEQVCRWAHEQQRVRSTDAEHHDHAIFLTRQPFGPGGMQGYAPVTGMCHPLRSCTLNHEDGFSSAFVVAHETGHVLGMEHDGQGNRCGDETGLGSVMAPLVRAAYHRYHWSRCSRRELSRYIQSYDCLHDDPFDHAWPKQPDLPGITYSMDEQCRFDFGIGYRMCSSFRTSDPCKQLWCSHPDNAFFCKTKKGPPLDGTDCGVGKWCFKGHCLWKSQEHMGSLDGTWGGWSSFSGCSRSCGGGVKSRSRRCLSPALPFGGSSCLGLPEEFRLCNKDPCFPNEDFRGSQCRSYDSQIYNNKWHHWLPYEHPDASKNCELTCRSQETGEVRHMNQVLHDGTMCSYLDLFSLCVRGQCMKVGCDMEFGSNKTEDKCGICGGDNSHCRTVKGTVTKTPMKLGLLRMFDIPAGARHIYLYEDKATPHYIAMRDLHTRQLLQSGRSEDAHTRTFLDSNMHWKFVMEEERESLSTTGPLHNPISILINSRAYETKVTLSYKYIIHEDLLPLLENNDHDVQNSVLQTVSESHKWALKSWAKCSRRCGGGIQFTKYGCRRQNDGRMVHRRFCDLSKKPKAIHRPCNEHKCSKPRWFADKWSACDKHCGGNGTQSRRVRCLHRTVDSSTRSLNQKRCTGRAPKSRRSCNRKPCVGLWKTGAWSQCSKSCGRGLQRQQAVCVAVDEENDVTCEGEEPKAIRECNEGPCQGLL